MTIPLLICLVLVKIKLHPSVNMLNLVNRQGAPIYFPKDCHFCLVFFVCDYLNLGVNLFDKRNNKSNVSIYVTICFRVSGLIINAVYNILVKISASESPGRRFFLVSCFNQVNERLYRALLLKRHLKVKRVILWLTLLNCCLR